MKIYAKNPNEENQGPNLRELPDKVKPMVGKSSQEYVVSGDGPCLLRTTAANLFGDHEGGPHLARDLKNTRQNTDLDMRKKYVSTSPFIATIGIDRETKVLHRSTQYFDWI